MKQFTPTKLFLTLQKASQEGVDPDSALNEFATELHDYCRGEKDFAERTRTLWFARNELSIVQERIHSGEKKKCHYTNGHYPYGFAA